MASISTSCRSTSSSARAGSGSLARDLDGDARAAERRAQLVADRREELALLEDDARDAIGHAVEGATDVAHLLGDPAARELVDARCAP